VVVSSGAPIATTETLRSVPGFVRFLSVAVSRRRFAIPLDRVIGVAESTKITPLPFSLPPFEGLVVAMGQVVPQIGLAPVLDLPSSEGGVVVLISDLGGSVGLRVEQVHTILQVDSEHVRLASPEQRAAEPMIIGRFGEGPAACGVLDLDHLTRDTSTMTASESGAVLLATETEARAVDDDDTTEEHAEP
jgi:chemotaxis signal transduction protein